MSFVIIDNEDLIELSESKSENEENEENELEDEIVFLIFIKQKFKATLSDNFIQKEDLLPLNYFKIITPPPEYSFYI